MQKDTAQSVPAQGATSENAAYDAFVHDLDFSSGKYETRIVSPTKIQATLPGVKHAGDVWRAKLFAADVIEKYGPGKHDVAIVFDGVDVLRRFIVEG